MASRRKLLAPTLLGALVLTGVSSAQAAPGSLDHSFGKGGKVVTRFGGGSDAQAVALQRDGKIVVAGWAGRNLATTFALARYTKRGALDRSFGKGGIVRTAIGPTSYAQAVAIQPNGKLVVAGYTDNGSKANFALARYRPTGSLDPSFGTGGIVISPLPSSGVATAIALQPDGKIVAGGQGDTRSFALVRYRRDGSLDPSFGTGGGVSTAVGFSYSHVSALALQPGGKILAAGSVSAHEVSGMAFARYNSDGSLDASFGSGGSTTMFTQGLSVNGVQAVRMQGSRILAAGTIGSSFALLRLQPNGSLDPSFGEAGDGTTRSPTGGLASSLAVQRDGRIVLAGEGGQGGKFDFMVARYTREGYVDSSFGPNGFVTTRLSSGEDYAHGLVVQRDGRIVAAGAADEYQPGAGFGLARYLASYTCRVPRVTGLALSKARHAIVRAHCTVGAVARAFSETVRVGRVISQQPAPGTTGAEGTKVRLIVSKGRRP